MTQIASGTSKYAAIGDFSENRMIEIIKNIYIDTAENMAIVVILPMKNMGPHARLMRKWKWKGTVNTEPYHPAAYL